MAGIRLEWAQFGHFDSFDVIRSDTSMASIPDTNLPSPIATNLKTMYFVDTTVVQGAVYFYKIKAWRDSVSVVSDEINVIAGSGYYQFYRIYITQNSGNLDGYSEMQEVEFAESIGGVDITSAQMPTNQSSYYASRTASKLVDNDLTNGEAIWTSDAPVFPQWVSFNFGGPKKIAELRIYPTNSPYFERAPKNFVVQGSNDAIEWENIKEFVDVLWPDSNPKSFILE